MCWELFPSEVTNHDSSSGETSQQLRALAALLEDMGSLPKTFRDSKLPVTSVPGALKPSCGFCRHQALKPCTDIICRSNTCTHKIKKEKTIVATVTVTQPEVDDFGLKNNPIQVLTGKIIYSSKKPSWLPQINLLVYNATA